VELNIVDTNGYYMRNDMATSLAFVGEGFGYDPVEHYIFYNPFDLADTFPIQIGAAVKVKNVGTDGWCRLDAIPLDYALRQPPKNAASTNKGHRRLHQLADGASGTGRQLLQLDQCFTQGLVCDGFEDIDGTEFVFDGNTLTFNDEPMVQSPGSYTWLLSADPGCTVPNGEVYVFQAAAGRE
jgi:hypothetical protein